MLQKLSQRADYSSSKVKKSRLSRKPRIRNDKDTSLIDLRNRSKESLKNSQIMSSRQSKHNKQLQNLKHQQLRQPQTERLPKLPNRDGVSRHRQFKPLEIRNKDQLSTHRVTSKSKEGILHKIATVRRNKSKESKFRISKSKESIRHKSRHTRTYDQTPSKDYIVEQVNKEYAKFKKPVSKQRRNRAVSRSTHNSPNQSLNIIDYDCTNTFA